MEKEVVYFMKHIGIAPIKVGRSTGENLQKRFEAMKCYSPYGAELLAVINTDDATTLEKTIHNKYSQYRLYGEWFNLTKDHIDEIIIISDNAKFINKRSTAKIYLEENDRIAGKSKTQQIIFLYKSGLTRHAIAKELDTPYSYVSKIINNNLDGQKYRRN